MDFRLLPHSILNGDVSVLAMFRASLGVEAMLHHINDNNDDDKKKTRKY